MEESEALTLASGSSGWDVGYLFKKKKKIIKNTQVQNTALYSRKRKRIRHGVRSAR